MARAELMKQLLKSYGRDDEFMSIAEKIIAEEESKNNKVLASSLRKTIQEIGSSKNGQRPLIPLSLYASAPSTPEYLKKVDVVKNKRDIVLNFDNQILLSSFVDEYRAGEEIRRHGLQVRSKILFCGPPGSGKTLCAEVLAAELSLPLYVVQIDRLISSYLGETASNIRKIFEFASVNSCILFFDEFDAVARDRELAGEHGEIRRVVNSLLLFIEQFKAKGLLIAATNLTADLDKAIWRRFDEVVWFDAPDRLMIIKYLSSKLKNIKKNFEVENKANSFDGFSYAEIERVCIQSIKNMIVSRRGHLVDEDFERALLNEKRRRLMQSKV